MDVVDYSCSYLFFTTKGRTNTARLMVEARCEVWEEIRDTADEYFLFASCKAEDTYAPRGLFKDPNYDFCGIFSATEFKIFRAAASYEQDMHSTGTVAGTFEEVRLLIRRQEHVRILEGTDAIIQATLDGLPLVGRTEIVDATRKLRVTLEYPIKTMNVSREKQMFQVDTGPVLLPGEQSAPDARLIAGMQLAFIAYNRLDAAELLLQQPAPVLREGKEVCRVLHYAQIRELPAKNEVLVVG